MLSIETMRTKIRALCEDFNKYSSEVRIREDEDEFTLSEEKISSVIKVKINGVLSTDYTYDATYNVLDVTKSGFAAGDIVEVFYSYTTYTNSEIAEYIRAALVYLSLYSTTYTDYELEDDDIFPTPDNAVVDLICLIAAIIIKPNYSKYSLPGGVSITYPKNISKTEKIQKLIVEFQEGIGITDLLTEL